MKTKLFHGTTEENFKKIMENGFNYNDKKAVWSCSDLEVTYFYNLSKIKEYDEIEENKTYAIHSAFENAGITASQNDYKGNKLIVMEFEIEEDLVEDDLSCPNMDYASCVEDKYLRGLKPIKIYILDYHPSLKLFYMRGVNKDYFNFNLDYLEEEALKIVEDTDFLEELISYEWDEETI